VSDLAVTFLVYPWAYMNLMPCGQATSVKGSKERLIKKIQRGKLYGFVQCSMRVKPTEKYYNMYCEHPPFYVTRDITSAVEDDKGNEKEVTNKKLSSYMECHDVLIGTPLFLWYLQQPGIQCLEIEQVIAYKAGTPYKAFVELGAEMRRSKNKIAGNLWKLMLNSAFGKMAQNNAAYDSLLMTTDIDKVNRHVNKSHFKSGSEVTINGETLFKIKSAKRKVKQNMPIQGACMILTVRTSN